ncbi:hypothetical protein PHMEG_00012017, partial [Phytophthora megakarya]
FNLLVMIFPVGLHFFCGCWNPFRTDTWRNARVNEYSNNNCHPYREIERVSILQGTWPRLAGYRFVLKHRPKGAPIRSVRRSL